VVGEDPKGVVRKEVQQESNGHLPHHAEETDPSFGAVIAERTLGDLAGITAFWGITIRRLTTVLTTTRVNVGERQRTEDSRKLSK
jgi:hypothetical protein